MSDLTNLGDTDEPFFRELSEAANASSEAGGKARAAMQRVARSIVGKESSEAQQLRALLLNIFNGTGVSNLATVLTLDREMRAELCAVIKGVNCPGCPDSFLRDSFYEAAGDAGVAWFTSVVMTSPEQWLEEALEFCKPGPLSITFRTEQEGAVARFLFALFLSRQDPASHLECNGFSLATKEQLIRIFRANRDGFYSPESTRLVAVHFSVHRR